MPISWLSEAECECAKRIHLKVATGSTVRALLYNNVIYAKSVNQPLVSIDLRFIWDDALPLLLTCHAGKNYVVMKANIVHHLRSSPAAVCKSYSTQYVNSLPRERHET